MQVLHYLTLGIGFIGISVIVWGVILSVKNFVIREFHRKNGTDNYKDIAVLRRQLGSYLLLGLEFLIAADIVNTIIKPSLDEVIILGAIVAIRTVLTYSLNKEVSDNESRKSDT
ncbi:MAG: DUF1622 domain-containing protein [Campylobacterota bacterium]|nr:DUF1622 domain-containing protein [Campylobacterota bacterium]